MESFCAFLRGINVNGRNMNMRDVCGIFQKAGMENVSSVLSTGNILFKSDIPAAELRGQLEQAISLHYSCGVSMFIKNTAEVKAMPDSSPFAPDPVLHIYAFISEPGFEKILAEEFAKITPVPQEAATVQNGLFYWQVPKGSTLDAGFSKTLGRKDMKDKFTSRNLNTIQKICDKMVAENPQRFFEGEG